MENLVCALFKEDESNYLIKLFNENKGELYLNFTMPSLTFDHLENAIYTLKSEQKQEYVLNLQNAEPKDESLNPLSNYEFTYLLNRG